ncbi:hypothetical protein ACI2KG_00795 [Pseudomonas sp. NPDC089407]|uniref:hypothetical protein n=1 Tax=Pseudomonas sp. NPDC089407 TaxID=3364464 RepID=UPI00384AED3A
MKKTIILELDVLENVIKDLPEESPAGNRLREIIAAAEEARLRGPVAYLAHRRDAKGAGRAFVAQPGRSYDQTIYVGPYPVYAQPLA